MGKPLAVRWLAYELPELRAGAVAWGHVEVENVGGQTWMHDGGPALSYHWLDDRGNAIVWDGYRSPLAESVAPGERTRAELAVRAPIPPGRYSLSIDLVEEGRFWFGELGNAPLLTTVDVRPRIATLSEATLHFGDATPGPGWEQLVLAAHREGYAVVGCGVELPPRLFRRVPAALAPYTAPGRVPSFTAPLICPSILGGVQIEWTEVAGLPAVLPPRHEPYLYDGRIRVRPAPAGRRH